MALVLADRVLETTTVTGTGDASLSGAQANYQPFSVIGNTNTTYYTIVDNTNNSWEVGVGTYVLAGNKITRDTVLSSSNGGALVYFASGTKDIFLDLPSEKVLLTAGNVYGPSSAVNSNFAAFDMTTGKLIKDSGYNASTFATAAQGAKADTAVQPGSLGTAAYLNAGVANGVATLDSAGKVPVSQIPQMGDLNYQGTWNATTNVPTLTSSAGTKGYYYVVATAGSTNLNGITDWKIGDWAVFNGSVWEKIDNTDAVTSVNGYTGTVVLTAADVSAIPYTGATGAVDLNAKTLVNVANLGVNTTTVPTIKFRAVGDNNSGSRIAMRGYSSDANSSSIRVSKFRGTSGAPQAPISGDSLGKFELAGYGTTASEAYPQVSLEGVTTEVWGATARGAKALIKVTPNTTITQVTAVTVDQDSKVTLAGALAVTGATTLATSLSGIANLTSGVVSTATSTGTGSVVLNDSPTFTTAITSIGALQLTGSSSVAQNIATSQETGALNIGGASATGALTFGRSTQTQTVNIGTGITANGKTKTINIGTGGSASPNITVNMGKRTSSGVTALNLTGNDILLDADIISFTASEMLLPSLVGQSISLVADLIVSGYDGYRAMVTDADLPVVGQPVIGGGTNIIPVYCNGTNWICDAGASGAVTSVTGTAPVVSSGGTTPAISMAAATTSVNGYLTSTDWTTFNNKQATLVSGTNIKTVNSTSLLGSGDVSVGVTSVTGTAPVVSSGGATPAISMAAATTSVNGYLTSTDWTTFNNKSNTNGTVTSVAALTLGTTGTDLSSTVATGTTTPVITLQVPTASATNRGALSSADWTTFNSKGSGTVTSVTGTAPVVSSGGAAPAISMAAATTSVNGYLTSTDWTTFNGKAPAVTYTTTYIPFGQGTTTPNLSANFTYTTGTGILATPAIQASNGIILNSKAIGTTFSIPSADNAMSVGPVTINSGVVITVPSGSRWIVI